MLPVSLSNPSCLSYRGTLDAMLAVPAVPPIEEDQMRLRGAICRLIDSKESFDRGSSPALLLGVELLHAKLNLRLPCWGQLRLCASPAAGLREFPSASSRSPRWLACLLRPVAPRFVDSGHARSYRLLQMSRYFGVCSV